MGELRAKQRAAAVEPGHHSSQRNRQRLGNFLVRQLLHVTKDDHFLKQNRNPPQRAQELFVRQLLWHRRYKGSPLAGPGGATRNRAVTARPPADDCSARSGESWPARPDSSCPAGSGETTEA